MSKASQLQSILSVFNNKLVHHDTDTIAAACGVSKQEIQKSLDLLVKDGQIEVACEISRRKGARMEKVFAYRLKSPRSTPFQAIKPLRQTVIPVRAGGKIAPPLRKSAEMLTVPPLLNRGQ